MARQTAKKDDPDEDGEVEVKEPKSRKAEEYDEEGILTRDSTTVDLDNAHVGVHLGTLVDDWLGDYDEIPPPTAEERARAAQALMAQSHHDVLESIGAPTRGQVGAHDYDASEEQQVPQLGIIYPKYD